MDAITPDTPVSERQRLRRVLGWACVLSLPFVTIELLGGLRLASGTLIAAFAVHGSLVLSLLFARWLALRASLSVAAQVMGYALLGWTLAANLAVGASTHLQLLVPMLATTLVLPYLTGRRLGIFYGVALLAEVAFAAQGIFVPERPLFPPPWQHLFEVAAIAVTFGLSLFVLQQFSARLRRMLRVRDEFLSVASHELRTPLTSLQLLVQGLLTTLKTPSTAGSSTRALVMIDRQVQKLNALIGELLDSTRIREGRLKLQLEEVDLSAVVREVAGSCAGEVARTGSTLVIQANESIYGYWDQLRLEQIVTNLLLNAVKFGTGKPVELIVGRENAETAFLVVRDHGIGIPADSLPRIFDRFEQAVAERHYGGLGLGLYITRSLVEVLMGSIAVESSPGEGSTFTVRLPLAALKNAPPR